jgi:hypothetical protein
MGIKRGLADGELRDILYTGHKLHLVAHSGFPSNGTLRIRYASQFYEATVDSEQDVTRDNAFIVRLARQYRQLVDVVAELVHVVAQGNEVTGDPPEIWCFGHATRSILCPFRIKSPPSTSAEWVSSI